MNKGALKAVKGDATSPQTSDEKEIVVIPHVCNNAGKWGAGFVLALSKKWEEPERIYRSFIDKNKHYETLGRTCFAKINNKLAVANMIGQNGTVSADNPKPIKYHALSDAMYQVFEYVEMIKCQTSNPVVIHAPKFGSLRAGGNWDFILELIREIWLENGIDVVIYEFEK